ncbi:MAG: glycoside hydrolase family protein [Azoarcus sp.]|jgi:GH24 family phage-related lysozyme (muramidase)|nr:glycoside hydrolase family protein [Azoarcus sp.]
MKSRLPIATLTASAAFLIALAVSEGYAPAVVKTAADPVPTGGFGSTKNEAGQPLQLGEALPPVRALVVLRAHVTRDEACFQRSLPGVKLTQGEYDTYLDFVYQYGCGTWQKSTSRARLLAGDYQGAADAILRYRYSNGVDCSAPGNKTCSGVWTRQRERHARLIAEIDGAEK